MPTYDYQCSACGHEFELFQQMTEPVKRKCPKCGKPKLQRLIGTGAGVLFKGGGFYETDYRSESYKKAADADKKAAEPAKAEKSDSSAVSGAATSSGGGGAGGGAKPQAASDAPSEKNNTQTNSNVKSKKTRRKAQ